MSNRPIYYDISDNTVLILSIVVAALFWFLNKMTENYQMNVRIPIKYEQADSMTFAQPPLKAIDYVVKSQGWNLISLSNSSIEEDTIYLKIDDNKRQTYMQSELMRFIDTTSLSGFNIIDTRPENLEINQAKAVYKKVPVKIPLSLEFKKDFNVSGLIKTNPDSIWVKGPHSEIQDIHSWSADSIHITALADTINRSVELKNPNSSTITLSTHSVLLTLPVEQYTENKIYKKIDIVNPIDSNMTIFPERIRLKFKVPLSKYEKVGKEDFRVIVDGKRHIINENQLLITINRKSPWIKDLDYEPKLVEFFISK